jgi:gas vesicle protein
MAYDDRDNGTSAVLVSFLLGALTGAGIALLLAPRSGRETREALGESLRDAAEKGRALGERVAEKGREAAEGASRLVDRGRDILDKV